LTCGQALSHCIAQPEKKSSAATRCLRKSLHGAPPMKAFGQQAVPILPTSCQCTELAARANVSCCWHIKWTKHSENVLQNLRKRNMNTPVASSKIESASQKRSPHGQVQCIFGNAGSFHLLVSARLIPSSSQQPQASGKNGAFGRRNRPCVKNKPPFHPERGCKDKLK